MRDPEPCRMKHTEEQTGYNAVHQIQCLVEIKDKPINNIDETFYVQGTKQIVVFNFLVFIKCSVKGDHKSN